jgi:ABC-type Mn2+/Zn2+ transport system ATPase subunit
MLSITDISVRIAGRLLIDHGSAQIVPGARVGLVGRNGAGKSTLFQAIRGELPTETGTITLPPRWRVGSLAQEAPNGPESLVEVVLKADLERDALLREAETAHDPHRIAEIQTRLVDIDAHSAPARAAAILGGLGFSTAEQARPCSEFSGGWRMRVALAATLFAAPDLLLLDEPTNYLDLEGTLWLEDHIAHYPRTVVVISHDRDLLDSAVDSILHLDDGLKSNYILVQTNGPLTDSQRSQLEKLGAIVHEYVSENTYLCTFKPKSLTKVRALKFVTWAGVYMEGFKIPPNLRESLPAAGTATLLPQAAVPSTRRTPRQVDIVLHGDVDPNDAELRKKIAAAARINPEDLVMSRHKVRLNVQERYLRDVAAIDEVRHVEEVPERKLYNNVARPIMNASVVVNGTPFQGEGQLVNVADTGFDLGSTTNVHPAFTGRVVKLVPLGRPGRADDPDSHGTHVCGSVLGDGTSSTMGGVIQGTAPKAKLIVQSLLDSSGGLGGIPNDLHDLFGPAFNDKARVHTNSWGPTTPGLPYSQASREIDDFVFNHPDFVICFAAGNDGIDRNNDGVVDEGQIGGESAAKNCITVGASENNRPNLEATYGGLRPSSYPHSPLFADRMASNPNGMAAFSSRSRVAALRSSWVRLVFGDTAIAPSFISDDYMPNC